MNNILVNSVRNLSYSKISGLRSMQHITDKLERKTIEAHRNELTHDIWGDANKLREWALNKIEILTNKEYPSSKLDSETIQNGRTNAVKKWYQLIKTNPATRKNPLLQLNILKFVTSNLLENNKQIAPVINNSVLTDAAYQVQKTGASFKKTYYKLLSDFFTKLNINIEETASGKWYIIKVPDEIEAKRKPVKFNKIKDFIAVLSQGSNWCTRNPATVGKDYSNCFFNIFVDNTGAPQICMTSMGNSNKWFEFIRGKDQYALIPEKFKEIIKSFFKAHNIDEIQVGNLDNIKTISEILK